MEKLKILKELVNIRSFDTNQNKEIIDYLELQFKPFSQEIIKVKNKCDGRESLLVGINTKLKNISDAVVLSGHIDTVVANEKAYKNKEKSLHIQNFAIKKPHKGGNYGLGRKNQTNEKYTPW